MRSFFLFLALACKLLADPTPIQFSIPECKVVQKIPEKDKDFAFLIPGNEKTYIYDSEKEYYKDYQRSYFAVTRERGGWDSLRHYEILANGCIPYFPNLDQCDPRTMPFLPKELIKEAMHLEGVSYLHIDHSKFDKRKYHEILQKLLAHTRQYLTTKQMASYLLKKMNYTGSGKILYLSGDTYPDYLSCTILIGLKELFQERVVDFPKIKYIYKNYVGASFLYGKGFSYTKIFKDLPMDRENIEERIKAKEFDLIIYGAVHRGLPLHDLVCQTYEAEKIVHLCGSDGVPHINYCEYIQFPNLFMREF